MGNDNSASAITATSARDLALLEDLSAERLAKLQAKTARTAQVTQAYNLQKILAHRTKSEDRLYKFRGQQLQSQEALGLNLLKQRDLESSRRDKLAHRTLLLNSRNQSRELLGNQVLANRQQDAKDFITQALIKGEVKGNLYDNTTTLRLQERLARSYTAPPSVERLNTDATKFAATRDKLTAVEIQDGPFQEEDLYAAQVAAEKGSALKPMIDERLWYRSDPSKYVDENGFTRVKNLGTDYTPDDSSAEPTMAGIDKKLKEQEKALEAATGTEDTTLAEDTTSLKEDLEAGKTALTGGRGITTTAGLTDVIARTAGYN